MLEDPASPFLSSGFAPLLEEFDLSGLRVDGRLPDDLCGTFYRIGPNPRFTPRAPYNPLNGDGMIHAFRVRDGRVGYQNRWVRTAKWLLEDAAGRALFGTSGALHDRDPSVLGVAINGSANTNLVRHGGRLLVLEEGFGPIEIDPETLETRGDWTFEGRLKRNMTAHPKVDPATGEMLFIANFEAPRAGRRLGLHWVDPGGALVRSEVIDGPYPALVHDFAITARFIVLVICPATVSVTRMMAGGPPVAWNPELPVKVGLVPRTGPAEARWRTAPAAMVWHTLNAFDDGDRVVVDLCQQAAAMFPRADGAPPVEALARQRLARWTLAWTGPDTVEIETLWDGPCEYPRIDERRTGRRHRYGYFACDGGPGSGDLFQRGLARFDVETGALARWPAGSGFAVGEPVFCPATDATAEDDGYVLTTIFDEGRGSSCLAVLRADDLAGGPIARAHTPHRVPMGFHGLWVGRD